jgi:heterodisulfide reductase subunit B
MKEFAVFWGCTIPARFPFIEKAVRLVFDDLGATAHDLEGFTCCPEGVLVKSNDEDVFFTTAARNLALVEKSGHPIVTPCNGCYSTFKETQSHLRTHWREKDEINERLAREDLHYEGDLQIRHFAEWLAEDMGAGLVASKATRPLWGVTVAVHYGCHLLRPQPAVRWDDPMHPTKVEGILTALGANVVDYTDKMDCCGQALDRVGEREGALAFGRRKLSNVQKAEADALVVVCPSCFQQFDLNQAALQRAKEDINVPVFYLAELIALAYGHEPDEIGLGMHRVSVEPFLEKWVARTGDKVSLSEHFDVSLLAKCYSCQACKDDCPVCKVDTSFEPTEMIARLLRGEMEEVVAEGQAWKCLECFTCQELCHSDIGMAETFRKLKEIAAGSDQGPESVSAAYGEFLDKGVLGKPRESARKKLGLEPLPDRGGESLGRVLAGSPASDAEGDEG